MELTLALIVCPTEPFSVITVILSLNEEDKLNSECLFLCLHKGLENDIVGCFSKTKMEAQKKIRIQGFFCVEFELYTVKVRTFRSILPSLAEDFLINYSIKFWHTFSGSFWG